MGRCDPSPLQWAQLYSQMSMSAEASFPEGPKWIRMNLPWKHAQEVSAGLGYTRKQLPETSDNYKALVISHFLGFC